MTGGTIIPTTCDSTFRQQERANCALYQFDQSVTDQKLMIRNVGGQWCSLSLITIYVRGALKKEKVDKVPILLDNVHLSEFERNWKIDQDASLPVGVQVFQTGILQISKEILSKMEHILRCFENFGQHTY